MQQELFLRRANDFPSLHPYTELTIDFAKGVMMNSWPNEILAEVHRQRILEEVEQIRLEKLVRKSGRDRPGFFERMRCNVANWMISTGKQLSAQHEISKEEPWIHPHTKATS